MGVKDLAITPVFLIIILIVAVVFARKYRQKTLRQYFFMGLTVRLVSAILLGILYQYYYSGGDTFYYFYHSGVIWDALIEDPIVGLKILFTDVSGYGDAHKYTSRMFWYRDPSSFFVGKVGAVFDLLTYHTYSATSLFFAVFSFSGAWAFFRILTKRYPGNFRGFAFAILFFPSLIFWGSGFLKDSLTLGATYWLVYFLFKWIELKQFRFKDVLWFAVVLFIIVTVKIYIIVSLIPAVLIWITQKNTKRIRSLALRLILGPLILIFFVFSGYISTTTLISDESKYSLSSIAQTAAIASHDIGHVTGRDSGSGYSFGRLDGTFGGMMRYAHLSISVSFFRPFLWEVSSPFMLIASLESLLMLAIFVKSLSRKRFRLIMNDPFLTSALLFSMVFAFAVGFTYNFGTLMRYRIPMLSFFLIPLLLRDRSTSVSERIRPSVG